MGWQVIDNYLKGKGIKIGPPRENQTTGGVHSPGSYHYKGLARDYGDADSDCGAIMDALMPHKHLFLELFYAPRGVWHPKNVGGHQDHVHAAIRADVTSLGGPGQQQVSGGGPQFPGRLLNVVTDGEDVRAWQQQMASRGWPITVDGSYGPASKEICIKFQQEKGLTADGIVGAQTWDAAWSAPVT
ncbi:MAG TPA: peptidoglycan-binding domain-containing protein [Acidimicrobiales bacterium]|nr:peptidoglycan-binding domain-containing protein [Acidimicrobiales bacterium]